MLYTTPPPPNFLKIYGTSTASYVENKCSTYQRYASALFSPNSLYLNRLFPKKDYFKKTNKNTYCKQHSIQLFYQQLSHKTPIDRKKDIPFYMFFISACPFGLGQVNPNRIPRSLEFYEFLGQSPKQHVGKGRGS